MAPMMRREVTHYEVVCCFCRTNAQVCLKKRTKMKDPLERARDAFMRGGWKEDAGRLNPANTKWFCPTCARASH
jgi:hypothetical protein